MTRKLSFIITFISSQKTVTILLLVYSVLLGVATFIEKYCGTPTALELYHHPIMGVLWALWVAGWLVQALRRRLSVRLHVGYYLLHVSFVFIMVGAVISHFCGMEGVLHIREGERTNLAYTNKAKEVKLPFFVHLNDFQLTRYPGSDSPQSYKSIVSIYEKNAHSVQEIYMNKVATVGGYRLFQTAYDPDERGTILTVSHDPAGMIVTYIGYAFLLVGIICCPLQKRSRLRRLIKKLQLVLVLLVIPASNISAQTDWSSIQVQNPNGRIEPIDTYCRTIMRKVCHQEEWEGMNAVEFVLDLIGRPDHWNEQPIIYQSNKELREELCQENKYISLNALFDEEGNYLLRHHIAEVYNTPPQERDKRQKALLKLDEKINILLAIEQGQMLPLFPLPGDKRQRWFSPGDDLSEFQSEDSLFVSHVMPWYISEPNQEIVDMIAIYQAKRSNCLTLSDSQIACELVYNRMNPIKKSAIGYLCGGLLLLILMLIQILRPKAMSLSRVSRVLTVFVLAVFVFHTVSMGIRWYVGGQAPWSNAYESMVMAAWCTMGGCLIFVRRSPITISLGAIFAGILLMVCNMNWMNPSITPLVPVLQSCWLMIHVAVIMGGYGFFAISFLMGIINLILMAIPRKTQAILKQIKELSIINEISLLIGLPLMTAGTFLGAIWANEAWGRYWGWDPKETWALITILVYTIVTHAHLIRKFNNEYALNVMAVGAFGSVLMTYLGVNYYLSGMHSYGAGETPTALFPVVIVFVLLVLLCVVAARQYFRNRIQ